MSMLAPTQEEKLFKILETGRKLNVKPQDELRFFMTCARNIAYIVDLTDNTCTCSRFQLRSFSCEHTIVVTIYRGFVMRTLCSPYYMTNYLIITYAETIFPQSNEAVWEVPDHIFPFDCLFSLEVEPHDPDNQHTSKIPSNEDFSQPRGCDRYKVIEHTH